MCQALNFSTVGTVVGAQDTTKNKTKIYIPKSLYSSGGKR